jgi:ribonuclease BN (tRNA processing enzyme)
MLLLLLHTLNSKEPRVTDPFVTVRARAVPHAHLNCFAWTVHESAKPGKFDPEKAQQLGLIPALHYRDLQAGLTVELANGQIVTPEQVRNGPSTPGRKVRYICIYIYIYESLQKWRVYLRLPRRDCAAAH